MPVLRVCLLLLLMLFLAGCSPVASPTLAVATAAREALASQTAPPLAPTPSHTPGQINFTPSPRPNRSPTQAATATASQPAPGFCSPLAGHTLADLREIVTNSYDPPPAGKDSGHHGVDFSYYRRGERVSIEGVEIQAVMAGRVAAVIQNRPPYGFMVILATSPADLPLAVAASLDLAPDSALYTLYAHMGSAPLVALGDNLACGETLGFVGNTPPGWSSNPHLHFEARLGPAGAIFESMAYYDTSATPVELANYERWRMSGDFELSDPLDLLVAGLGD